MKVMGECFLAAGWGAMLAVSLVKLGGRAAGNAAVAVLLLVGLVLVASAQ